MTTQKLRDMVAIDLKDCDHPKDGSFSDEINTEIQREWEEGIYARHYYDDVKPDRYTPEYRDHYIYNEITEYDLKRFLE